MNAILSRVGVGLPTDRYPPGVFAADDESRRMVREVRETLKRLAGGASAESDSVVGGTATWRS